MLTHERLTELLKYDQETGFFSWLVDRNSGQFPAGSRAGGEDSSSGLTYRRLRIDGKKYKEHRLAWFYVHGRWPTAEIDHVNLLGTDNRFANLREASHGQNQANSVAQKRNRLGVKGVKRCGGKFGAFINSKKTGTRYLGSFNTAEEASAAYLTAARQVHGEFARGA